MQKDSQILQKQPDSDMWTSLVEDFRAKTSDTSVGYTCAKRILEIPAHSTIRNDDGFPDWSHRVGSIGNAVNPTVAKYLFECIKIFDKQLA